jgi:group II intron reverse transcriptase/maturase
MQNAQTYLEIVKSRGERKLELKRVYRNLRNQELFLIAYGKLYANDGAMTPGIDPNDTVDNMSWERIDKIIAELAAGTYQWNPTRRTYLPKGNGKYRPLGIPGWDDKLLQEVIRMVLSAYYEPQFSPRSHGFRPGKGCHTALQTIQNRWIGTKWFIEGDIHHCFDEINQTKLLQIIARNIKDERFLKLMQEMMEAGYMDDWQYQQTYSGVPQGNVISPLLANIYLHELDKFVEDDLLPQYNAGEMRKNNPRYNHQQAMMAKAWRHGDRETHQALAQELRTIPSKVTDDPHFRRLKYIRYADDFLLGFIGPQSEAQEIKQKIKTFLKQMGLTFSEEKTLITHATTGRARFLGYNIHTAIADSKQYKRKRTVNGKVMLTVPAEVIKQWCANRMKKGKPVVLPALKHFSDFDIVMKYQLEIQGLVNYYKLAYDVSKLHRVKGVYLQSLVKTLASKHKKTARWVYKKHYRTQPNGYKALVVTMPRENKRPLIATFGGQPIRRDPKAIIADKRIEIHRKRTQLIDRLLADKCELCGATTNIRVHHIRKLKNLKRRHQGQRTPPMWVIRMIEMRRKTLVVCQACHTAIHAGTYDGKRLKQGLLESRMNGNVHVRFGGGRLEKCHPLATRWPPTRQDLTGSECPF